MVKKGTNKPPRGCLFTLLAGNLRVIPKYQNFFGSAHNLSITLDSETSPEVGQMKVEQTQENNFLKNYVNYYTL